MTDISGAVSHPLERVVKQLSILWSSCYTEGFEISLIPLSTQGLLVADELLLPNEVHNSIPVNSLS